MTEILDLVLRTILLPRYLGTVQELSLCFYCFTGRVSLLLLLYRASLSTPVCPSPLTSANPFAIRSSTTTSPAQSHGTSRDASPQESSFHLGQKDHASLFTHRPPDLVVSLLIDQTQSLGEFPCPQIEALTIVPTDIQSRMHLSSDFPPA